MDAESGRHETGNVSVLDPLSPAIDWARNVLFRPFSFEKWIILGFCAWLARLGRGGGGGSGSSGWQEGGGGQDFEGALRDAWDWLLAHLFQVLVVGSLIFVVVVAIWLVVLWVSSRGKFMFLDGVVNDRAAVVEPWRRFRAPANSLFLFRIVVGLVGFAAVAGIVAFLVYMIWLRVEADAVVPLFVMGLVCGLTAVAAVVIALVLVRLAIDDFLVPLMYLNDCPVGPAWRELRGLLSLQPGAFFLFVVVKIVIAVVVGLIGILACCLTCCIVLLPYVGTVILLPVWVFLRAYPLYFLGQFGPRYARFARLGPEVDALPAAPAPEPPSEG